jgi:predicted phage terminase large subunit-like protein
MPFTRTARQKEAWDLLGGPAKHVMLAGGSGSGKTLLICQAIAMRALAARKSRHAVLRFQFSAVKKSVVLDTWPAMMEMCYPSVDYDISKTDWFARMPNDSEVWFGGLDDKERVEKILGTAYATLFFNECSQIPLQSRNIALTRLRQVCEAEINGVKRPLRLKAFYDENPPSQAHWSYKEFARKVEAETGKVFADPEAYAMLYMNPEHNRENLTPDYIATLERLPMRLRLRFLEGRFADITAGALWTIEIIDQYRHTDPLPDMQRMIVAVDPSGAADDDNAANDDIGILVCGLGIDGRGYVLEDVTCKAGPRIWGNVATNAYDRHGADCIVAEKNFGGEMVRHVIQTAKPGVPCKLVVASRGKVVRAEPISALTEQGKIRFAGIFPALEEELTSFTTHGYVGDGSSNRVDAFVWAMSELFPGMVKKEPKEIDITQFQPSVSVYPMSGGGNYA